MKKKNLNHKGLTLNKNVVSSLESGDVKGGRTKSCLADVDTNCATFNCGTIGCPTNGCQTNNACPTNPLICYPSISCEPQGIC